MPTAAKTIQIFLPDGNPRGVKIAEITSRTVQAIYIPRSLLDFALTRPELNKVGVYFLIGSTEEDAKSSLYIGEAENIGDRLKLHHRKKDFWTAALAVLSKTAYFTKSHGKYLEWLCCEYAARANRFALKNAANPAKPYVTEATEADLLDNFQTIKILVSALGYPIFDRLEKPRPKDILICRGKGALARGRYTEEGLAVFKGSTFSAKDTKGFKPHMARLRNKLLKNGLLQKDGALYVLTEDYVFSSPSAAASLVLANSSNGWEKWKDKSGKNLDRLQRSKN